MNTPARDSYLINWHGLVVSPFTILHDILVSGGASRNHDLYTETVLASLGLLSNENKLLEFTETWKAIVSSPAEFTHGSSLAYNIGSPCVAARLLVRIKASLIMFDSSVSSDLLESLVNWLNQDHFLTWYYVTAAPSGVQPNQAIGIVELVDPAIENLGDGTAIYKCKIAFTIEYHYNTENDLLSHPFESVKALSWLYAKIISLVRHGYSSTFSNGQMHQKLFSGANIISTQFTEPRLQDSLIGHTCQLMIAWEQAWYPQPPYLI